MATKLERLGKKTQQQADAKALKKMLPSKSQRTGGKQGRKG